MPEDFPRRSHESDYEYEEGAEFEDYRGASSNFSLASRRTDAIAAHGRRYPNSTYTSSPHPAGDTEAQQHELDMHTMYLCMYHDKLFFSPIEEPRNVLDVRCGELGLWIGDMADRYEEARIWGMNTVPTQNQGIPNLEYIPQDVDIDWVFVEGHDTDKFDFIHARHLFASVSDWERFYRQCYDNLAPGGYLEECEIVPVPSLDDGDPNPQTSMMARLSSLIPDMEAVYGTEYNPADKMRERFEAAGFVDIEERIIKLPWSAAAPPGTHEHDMGMAFLRFYKSGLYGWLVDPLTRSGKGTAEEVQRWCQEAIHEAVTKKPKYWSLAVAVYARKPLK